MVTACCEQGIATDYWHTVATLGRRGVKDLDTIVSWMDELSHVTRIAVQGSALLDCLEHALLDSSTIFTIQAIGSLARIAGISEWAAGRLPELVCACAYDVRAIEWQAFDGGICAPVRLRTRPGVYQYFLLAVRNEPESLGFTFILSFMDS